MKKGVFFAVAALTAAMAPFRRLLEPGRTRSIRRRTVWRTARQERMTTQVKGARRQSAVGTPQSDFTNGYATVTVKRTQSCLGHRLPRAPVHSVGRCEASSAATGGSTGYFNSRWKRTGVGSHRLSRQRQIPGLHCKYGPTARRNWSLPLARLPPGPENSSGTALVNHQEDIDHSEWRCRSRSGSGFACGVIAAARRRRPPRRPRRRPPYRDDRHHERQCHQRRRARAPAPAPSRYDQRPEATHIPIDILADHGS